MARLLSSSYTLRDHAARETDRYARAKYEITRRWIAPYAAPGKVLLNIGCGSGYFNRLAYDLGLTVVACEPDEAAFMIAEGNAAPGCIIHRCDLAGLSRMGAAGDFIVCHDVIEHIEDDAAAVESLHAMLQPGGQAVISVPALPSLFGRHDELLGHFRRYSRPSLSRLLSPYFHIQQMRYFGALSIPVVFVFSKMLRRDYPQRAGGDSFLGRAYGAVCDFEVGVTFPIGTSLLAHAVRK